jgi:hypothetical protein
MPPVKKPAVRKAANPSEMSAATRRQLEQAAKRLEKSLEEAQAALSALGQDVGQGGRVQYKHLEKAAKAMRRDAEKTNKQLRKDLEALAAAVTKPGAAKPAARKPAAARKATAARKPAAARKATAARKPATTRTTASTR